MGSRPHVSWGAMAGGPARTFWDWQQFQRLPEPLQAERTVGMRGSALMIADISEAIPAEWTQPAQLHAPSWMGAFTRTEVLIGVRGCSRITMLFFEVEVAGRLRRVQEEAAIIGGCTFQRIRVVGARDRRWQVDPDPDGFSQAGDWRLWAWDLRPLARLQWDPGEWQWRDFLSPSASPLVPFF